MKMCIQEDVSAMPLQNNQILNNTGNLCPSFERNRPRVQRIHEHNPFLTAGKIF